MTTSSQASPCKAEGCTKKGFFLNDLCREHRFVLCKCGREKFDPARFTRCHKCSKAIRNKERTYG